VDLPIPMAHRLDVIDEDEVTPTDENADYAQKLKKSRRKDAEQLISPSSDQHQKSYGSFLGDSAVDSKLAFFERHFKVCPKFLTSQKYYFIYLLRNVFLHALMTLQKLKIFCKKSQHRFLHQYCYCL